VIRVTCTGLKQPVPLSKFLKGKFEMEKVFKRNEMKKNKESDDCHLYRIKTTRTFVEIFKRIFEILNGF
jgi:hypothetical protein